MPSGTALHAQRQELEGYYTETRMTLAKIVTTLHEENRLHANQHNNSDRQPQTHPASLGLALKHTQRMGLSNTADSSPSKSH